MVGLPSGDVTFVFGDIEGSTALWESDPDAMRTSLEAHDALVRTSIQQAGGVVFKHTGDGFAAVFDRPDDAVQAACVIEVGLTGVGPLRLRSRMGIHRGHVVPRDDDYFGPDVNRAARLMDTANGGQIVLSGTTVDALSAPTPSGTTLHDAGAHRLKDLGEPMRIHRLVLAQARDDRPLRTLDVGRNNLPEQVTALVGRDDEAQAIASLVREYRVTTLTGIGGVGKTRLALQVAANMLHEFVDGVWLVELASLTEARLLAPTMLGALGVEQEPGRDALDVLLSHLIDQRTLVVIDNCEHLIDPAAKFVEQLLRAAPELRVLVTSREALAIAGEHVWRVPSLAIDSTGNSAAALELFEARARLVRPDFTIDESNRDVVSSICLRLDGIPLAIELATARLQMLDLDQISEHLDDRFRLLTGGPRTSADRQRTLRSMMDWSYALLTEREQTLLRRLSVFSGGFDLEATIATATTDSIYDFEVLDLLGRLVETSMVHFEQRPVPRYRLLETVRQYAAELLAKHDEQHDARRRHAAHAAVMAGDISSRFLDDAGAALKSGQRELANLRAAMTWAFDADEVELGLRIAIDAWEYFYNTSDLHESLVWLRRGVDRVASIDTPTAARALSMTITSARNMGELELAERLARRAGAAVETVEDPIMRADLINAIGNRMLWDDPIAADRHYTESIGLYRAHDNPGWVAKLINRFLVLNSAYRPEAAEELLALARETGGRSDAVQPAPVEAYLLLHQDKAAEALAVLQRSDTAQLHSRAAAMPHCWALVHANRALGYLAAARAAADAGAHWRVGVLDLIFGVWKDISLALDEGDLDRARSAAAEAGRAALTTQDPVWHAYFAALVARIAATDGRHEVAATALGHWYCVADQLGLRPMPHDQRWIDGVDAASREAIGEANFEASLAAVADDDRPVRDPLTGQLLLQLELLTHEEVD